MNNENPTLQRRPNILFILTDDHRSDTLGALGNPHIHTPNLDALVRRGFAFDRSFCTTPICTPARAELLTGCTSFANHVPWFGMPINPELTLLPQAFHEAGYSTLHIGKWHNDGHPRDKGYDLTSCVFPEDNLNDSRVHGHHMRYQEPGGAVSGHSTELFTDAAIRSLADVPGDRPWFCYLAYFAPHDPHDAPEPFGTLYPPGQMPLLPNYMPEHPFDNGDMVIRDELLENWPREQAAMRRYRARYYGMISHLDHHIGRLLGWLVAHDQLDNTIVALSGDQGLAIGSHGLLGKENMYDHSIASPLLYAGPGIPEGGRSSALVHHVDLFPTLCELTGIPRPASARDGFSLAPILRGEADKVREAVFCEFYSPEQPGGPLRHTQRAVRTARWKLTWYPQIDRYQLFDLQTDACELVDLLAGWRRRRRIAVDAGQRVWQKNIWAARDPRPALTQAEVDAATDELYGRLLEQMERHGDPLLQERRPPHPSETMDTHR
jgi:arylsulfatase A-like enzyme